MPSKAYLIDAAAHEIREVEVDTYHDISRLIGCHIFGVALHTPNGDVVYVDDEGMLNPNQQNWFWLAGRPDQPLSGNGLLMGADNPDDDENALPPNTTIEVLGGSVTFIDRATALDWALRKQSLPVTFTALDAKGGVAQSTVISDIMPIAFPEIQTETG